MILVIIQYQPTVSERILSIKLEIHDLPTFTHYFTLELEKPLLVFGKGFLIGSHGEWDRVQFDEKTRRDFGSRGTIRRDTRRGRPGWFQSLQWRSLLFVLKKERLSESALALDWGRRRSWL